MRGEPEIKEKIYAEWSLTFRHEEESRIVFEKIRSFTFSQIGTCAGVYIRDKDGGTHTADVANFIHTIKILKRTVSDD